MVSVGTDAVNRLYEEAELHDAITLSNSVNEWNSIPGSEILVTRQIAERPHRDFLMHQQGFLSGKTEGDLDSVPGYYGATRSYKWVQNAKALQQHRVKRVEQDRTLGRHYDEYGRYTKQDALVVRAAAFKAAASVPFTPYSSMARGVAYKHAGEYGAYFAQAYPPRSLAEEHAARGGFSNGIYTPPLAMRPPPRAVPFANRYHYLNREHAFSGIPEGPLA